MGAAAPRVANGSVSTGVVEAEAGMVGDETALSFDLAGALDDIPRFAEAAHTGRMSPYSRHSRPRYTSTEPYHFLRRKGTHTRPGSFPLSRNQHLAFIG